MILERLKLCEIPEEKNKHLGVKQEGNQTGSLETTPLGLCEFSTISIKLNKGEAGLLMMIWYVEHTQKMYEGE